MNAVAKTGEAVNTVAKTGEGAQVAGDAARVTQVGKDAEVAQSTARTSETVASKALENGLETRGYRPAPGERSVGKVEYKTQSSARRNFPGKQTEMNCAPQSSQQVIRASTGKTLTEAEMAQSAKASAGYNPKIGTYPNRVPSIMKAEGVEASSQANKAQTIEKALDEGKGVVSMHDAGKLWGTTDRGGHAVHTTGVVRDAQGNITHYVINDTGTGKAGLHVPAKQYEDSLLKGAPAAVSDKPLSYGGRTASESRRLAAKAEQKTAPVDAAASKGQASAPTQSGATKSGQVGATGADVAATTTAADAATVRPSAPSQYETPHTALSSRARRELRDRLESGDRSVTRPEYERYQWDRRFRARRQDGVDAFWRQERRRLRSGQPGSRNWTAEHREAILRGETPLHDGHPIQGHHRYNANNYPHLANDPANIAPATRREHLRRWHGGSWRNTTSGEPLNPHFLEEF